MPLAQANARPPLPPKRSSGLRLADAVHNNRAVRRCAAEEIAPPRVVVTVGSGIDDDRLAEHRALDTQQVGVTVGGAHRAPDWANVHHHVMRVWLPARTHHGIAARR